MTIVDQSYRIQGQRIGVLLIHGLCGTPSEMRFVANGLTRAGYHVHSATLAGHGGSAEELKASTWQDWYASAETALEEISKECETVVVGGLSTGAVLALLLAAQHPDKVQAIALFSPTLWLSGRQVPWYVPLLRLINIKPLANLLKIPVPLHVGIKDQRIRAFIRSALASDRSQQPAATPGGAALERRRLAKVVMRRLGQIAQPALIIHARDDDYAGLDNAAYLQRQLGGPVDLTVLDDSYHMVTIDRQRHVVVERTVAFVARIPGVLKAGLERAQGPRIGAALSPSAA